jgi:hypothetical protein
MIKAKLTVAAGAFCQLSWGETGDGEAWVYLSGITAPSAKDVLVKVMGVGGGAAFCAKANPPAPISMAAHSKLVPIVRILPSIVEALPVNRYIFAPNGKAIKGDGFN